MSELVKQEVQESTATLTKLKARRGSRCGILLRLLFVVGLSITLLSLDHGVTLLGLSKCNSKFFLEHFANHIFTESTNSRSK